IEDAHLLRTELSSELYGHTVGSSGLNTNMTICLLWHPHLPQEKSSNSKKNNNYSSSSSHSHSHYRTEKLHKTLLTAMADGSMKLWQWREEEDEVDDEEDEQNVK